ncbi:ABC transporter permease subunit [Natrialba taiwanensis]|uniref:Binding-protein-dependent transport system inner membrane protein n=1 Tax=Natrialba taiwanensis DSM 12281 TaxID=1230458 RepID=L9ZPU8_9EURY|nr:ABC transporter permease subunit [Natrialba taiwanensis]ELY88101.1 binding-protein-dependent transport system inner membrane protein [Natrialba taiwanensis DSM 12281]
MTNRTDTSSETGTGTGAATTADAATTASDTEASTAEPSSSDESGRAGLKSRAKWYVLSYPLFWLVAVFFVPLCMLVVFSFWENIPGGQYQIGFTLENYARFLDIGFTSTWPFIEPGLYLGQLWLTVELALVTAGLSLLLGYPMAYYLARMNRPWLRSVLLITIISSLWVTYVIRAYAWQVILASGGILSSVGTALGFLAEPQSFYPGYWGLVVGMVYVFLPFMILTLYSSLRNLDGELLEASKNLGAGPAKTFRRVTLPLSKNGVMSGTALVFILALGSYVLPRLLGSPGQRTLPVLIEQQIMSESNYPFGAAMSIGLIVVVLVFLWVLIRVTNVTTASLGGTEEIATDGGSQPARSSAPGPLTRFRSGLGTAAATVGLTAAGNRLGSALDSLVTRIDANTRESIIWVAFRTYVAAVMVYIALPLAIIIAVSFTPEEFLTFPPGGFSLQWYAEFFGTEAWRTALLNSLTIAGAAALLSTTIGGGLAFALDRFDYRWGTIYGTLGVLPILLPPVIIGVAFLVFFLELEIGGFALAGSRLGIIIAHGIFYAPFPFILISQGLDEIDRTYEEAAMNLGASSLRTIRTITYPLIRANVVSGALFAFILSLNEYIISWLLSLFLVQTIPIQIFNQLRYSYPPTIAAASVVFIFLTVVVMTAIDRLSGGIWE